MYTNDNGEILKIQSLPPETVRELDEHWYSFGRDDYRENKLLLGSDFAEQNGPCEARVEQVTDFENDAETRQFIADAYIRGWIDAAQDDTNE